MKEYLVLFAKGIGMGAANVIPGVSGGTIALITGIFEKLINSIKSLDGKAAKLLFTGKLKDFASYINMYFLIAVFAGIGVSIYSLAKLLDYLFVNYPVLIWAFFFGLILSSVFFVGKTISKWSFSVALVFVFGTAMAILISLMTPANENSDLWYLLICGIIAACSMILPGLSGSFVLILLGNYQLVMIDSVKNLDFKVLLPVVVGAGVGLLAFSHILAWVFKKFKNQTIALLTGFIAGSLIILWPWKNPISKTFGDKEKIIGYDWFFPEINNEFFLAALIIIAGIISIWLIEKTAIAKSE
ncbi:MAG: DUF368 domain-containing protein [Bacteroidales bacterium]|nr:DUF368 domain-containing protein [Bacteroidales bacterium]